MSGWMLRALLATACLILVGISLSAGAGVGVWTVIGIVLIGLAIGTVVQPASIAVTLLLLLAMLMRTMVRSPAIDWRLAMLVAVIPFVHQLAGICTAIPLRATVYAVSLRPALVRWLIAVSVVEAGLLIASLVG